MKIPRIAGNYIHVYQPQGDVFPGPDSDNYRGGLFYENWIPNDHMILKGKDGRWHAFGITQPVPPDHATNIHEAEWQSFHAVSPIGTLKEYLRDAVWTDLPKILTVSERPGERFDQHAPTIVEKDNLYYMYYGPCDMRMAISRNLYDWTPKGTVFSQEGQMRDPNVNYYYGQYVMVYFADPGIWARTSLDLIHWSEPIDIFRTKRKGALESPLLISYDHKFYLFWCIYDGENGTYDNRTYVYCSEDLFNFHNSELIAELNAHAPEVFQDEDGDWYISSAEWPKRGISIARLEWE